VERQVSPLTWLDAWLDNMMANVPELAVCYHKQGVVQGYELLKTEDLFLLKGMGADGTISFHPQVVHANAAAVLQFLQENCTSEPGTYWVSGSFRCLGFEELVTKFSSSIDSSLSRGEKGVNVTCNLAEKLLRKEVRQTRKKGLCIPLGVFGWPLLLCQRKGH
jgi:hypothetical protein